MSASLLYHTNQIEDIQVVNVEFYVDKIIFKVIFKPKDTTCSCCGCKSNIFKGSKERKLRMVPFGNKASFLFVTLHRLQCTLCSYTWWPVMPFVRGKKRVTLSFENYVIELMEFATIKHTANFLDVSWNLVKSIHKDHLNRTYQKPNLKTLRYVGVDEFSIRKGHNYMTIFINLETGKIIHAVEGKSMKSVTPFLLELKEKGVQLKAMAMDMNAAYASSVAEHLPSIDIVFDHFHIRAMLSKTIDEIRRDQQVRCNKLGFKVIKGMRFLLLGNYERLNPKKQSSLQCLLDMNEPIAIAHTMKEQIRLFWTKTSIEDGAKFLAWWIMDAIESGVKELQKTGRTLLRYWQGLVSYFKHPITNAKTEGINNKIKTMKRQAYGFRDIEYFKLRLYNLDTFRYSFG